MTFKVNGVSPAATYFLCLAKESKQRKARLDAAPTLRAGVPDQSICAAAAPLTRCAQTRGAQKIRRANALIGSVEWQERQRRRQKHKRRVQCLIEREPGLRDGLPLTFVPFDAAGMRVRDADLLSAHCSSAASYGRGRIPHTHLGNRRPQDVGSIEARLSWVPFFGKTKKGTRRKAKAFEVHEAA